MKPCMLYVYAVIFTLLCGADRCLWAAQDHAAGQPAGVGLQGFYYAGKNFESLSFVRIDPTVNFDWNSQGPAAGFPREQFSVRWIGKVQAKYTESYTLS